MPIGDNRTTNENQNHQQLNQQEQDNPTFVDTFDLGTGSINDVDEEDLDATPTTEQDDPTFADTFDLGTGSINDVDEEDLDATPTTEQDAPTFVDTFDLGTGSINDVDEDEIEDEIKVEAEEPLPQAKQNILDEQERQRREQDDRTLEAMLARGVGTVHDEDEDEPEVEEDFTPTPQMILEQRAKEAKSLKDLDDDEPELATAEKKPELATAEKKPELKPLPTLQTRRKDGTISPANEALFADKVKTYNDMFGTKLKADEFLSDVVDSWELMRDGDAGRAADGKARLATLFKNTIGQAFEREKKVAYEEHRVPDFAEIIRSTNELTRVGMFAGTDLYRNAEAAALFESTNCGGMKAEETAELTKGSELWSMDQKSDEAWEIQAQGAKSIADKWLSEKRPYETMINEMNALVEADKHTIVNRREMLNKLAAAEWLLLNNEKMMITSDDDPLNPIPNWGNRYWKALTGAREALGIDKHTSMRELIQADYAAAARAVCNPTYNKTQIEEYVLAPDARELYDSMDRQKEQFVTQSEAVILKEAPKDLTLDERLEKEKRVPLTIESENERQNILNAPKNTNFITDKTAKVEKDVRQA